MAKNAICHVEWASSNFEKTQKFYGGLFGWTFQPFGAEYLLFQAKDGIGGGFRLDRKVKSVELPAIYVEVDKIEPYLEKAKKVGGEVASKKTEIPTIGFYATLKDPDGNCVSLFQSAH